MQTQQQLLVEHFRKLGGRVRYQEFRARSPLNGSAVPMANLIIEWHPDRKERILLGAHYDTRPFPDQDPNNPHGLFIGANDGGSGVALLMELAHAMPNLKGKLGVDFVLFDGEELVYQEGDPYFLGSEYFADQYVSHPPDYRYRWGVLLDMIGDANLQIYQDRFSAGRWKDTKPLVTSIWDTAKRLGVREFIPTKYREEVRDDHLALHNIAKIPTCDIIDFDYPAWHKRGDTIDKCSALSLAKVGWVIQVWLEGAVR
jgi:Zn-dependent M28 family amino/carboxypeptidase